MIALAWGTQPIGIDIQAQPSSSHIYVAEALHSREAAEITTYPPQQRPYVLGRCWARKEAVLKAAGLGLGHGAQTPYVGAGPQPAAVDGVHLWDLAAPTGFASAVALVKEPDAINRWRGANT